ncbi:MAG: GNAT family N-acetyltransferase, partial [Nanoarchaeota archaeon]|nr:GNAT family N-acetyltransferase [Nanoarchaeota archaeon]
RRNLLKNKKRTYRDFSVLEKYITKREEIDEAIKTMVNINRKRWGRRNLPGTFTSKKIIDFYKDIAVYFLRRGYLSFCILDLDGKHAAYAFSFIYNAKMYDYSVGILPEKDFLKHGIGHVAYLSKLNLAYAKACLEFDFLRGEEDYKIKYSNAMRTTSETVIVKKSLQGKFILSVFRIKFMLRNFIKKNIPEKMQWKISSFLMKSGLYRV